MRAREKPRDLRRLDVRQGLYHQHLVADEAGVARPADDPHRDEHVADAGPERGDDRDDENVDREGDDQVEEPHEHGIDPPVHAGKNAKNRADDEGRDHRHEAELEIDRGAVDDAGEHVTAEIVGAEPVRRARRVQRLAETEGRRALRQHEWASDRDNDRRNEHREPDDERARQPAAARRSELSGRRRRSPSHTAIEARARGSRKATSTSVRRFTSITKRAKTSVTATTVG